MENLEGPLYSLSCLVLQHDLHNAENKALFPKLYFFQRSSYFFVIFINFPDAVNLMIQKKKYIFPEFFGLTKFISAVLLLILNIQARAVCF